MEADEEEFTQGIIQDLEDIAAEEREDVLAEVTMDKLEGTSAESATQQRPRGSSLLLGHPVSDAGGAGLCS